MTLMYSNPALCAVFRLGGRHRARDVHLRGGRAGLRRGRCVHRPAPIPLRPGGVGPHADAGCAAAGSCEGVGNARRGHVSSMLAVDNISQQGSSCQ